MIVRDIAAESQLEVVRRASRTVDARATGHPLGPNMRFTHATSLSAPADRSRDQIVQISGRDGLWVNTNNCSLNYKLKSVVVGPRVQSVFERISG